MKKIQSQNLIQLIIFCKYMFKINKSIQCQRLLYIGNQLSQITTSMLTPKLRTIILTVAQEMIPAVTTIQPNEVIVSTGSDKHHSLQQMLIQQALSKNQNQINHKEDRDYSMQEKKERNSVYRKYSIEFKHRLIEEIKTQSKIFRVSQSTAIRRKAKQYRIHPKNIYRWYRSKELKRKVSGRKALFPQMEAKLMDFILSHPTKAPKRRDILSQARKILDELQVQGREDFSFSKGWYQRFRERMNKMTNIYISQTVRLMTQQKQKSESEDQQQLIIQKIHNKLKGQEEIQRCLMETVKIQVDQENRCHMRRGKRPNNSKNKLIGAQQKDCNGRSTQSLSNND